MHGLRAGSRNSSKSQTRLDKPVKFQSRLGIRMFSKHHIFVTPIIHEEFQGLRITPNVYTTVSELTRFCEQMELIARNGLPS
jgi:hypothetical protein